MESELKDLSTVQSPEPKTAEPIHDDGSSAKDDDRPLLKPEPSSAAVTTESLEELEKKFAAYVRHDIYGPMGRGELPLAEKFLLGLALVTLVPIRVVVGMSILVFYYLICRICTLFLAPNRDEDQEEQEDYAHMGGWRRAVMVTCGRILSRVMLFVFGFYWIKETYQIPNTDLKSTSEVYLYIYVYISVIVSMKFIIALNEYCFIFSGHSLKKRMVTTFTSFVEIGEL